MTSAPRFRQQGSCISLPNSYRLHSHVAHSFKDDLAYHLNPTEPICSSLFPLLGTTSNNASRVSQHQHTPFTSLSLSPKSGLPLVNRVLRSDPLSAPQSAIQRSVICPAFTSKDYLHLGMPKVCQNPSLSEIVLVLDYNLLDTIDVDREDMIYMFDTHNAVKRNEIPSQVEGGRQLEAFSIQLVILAIWKQALRICHAQVASAIEGSSSQESTRLRRSSSKKHGTPNTEDNSDVRPEKISTQNEREFLREVEHAEELTKAIEPGIV
ncbi:hypothetical protein GH714_034814 [Hevea brasiliensis]|uniref:ATG1a/b/c MIT domain-containing protein n=1 Tax=Hevea brasiliensis TaxID=3981 RepID=A0A6A6N6T4_HEVBR|nr:hypothetical protein GH714_034814 [Hevea brasiliensis]